MKAFIALAALFVVVFAEEEACYSSVKRFCSPSGNDLSCNAKYGAIDNIVPDLQKYVNRHITNSFDYLLLSTHFANYEKNRPGFEKLYRKLSDDKWNDAIDLIKHIAKRGGSMDFNVRDEVKLQGVYEMSELESLAKALDIEKSMASEALSLHGEITRKRADFHDPEIGQYLEEEFMGDHAENVRKLSGFSNDLSKLLNNDNGDNSVAVFLFDEYLSKL